MAPIVRILARVLAGFLIGSGYFSQEASDAIFNDPAFDASIGVVLWAATEGFYYLAKRYGWTT